MVRQTLDAAEDGGRLGGLPMSQRREDPDRALMARVEARDTEALAELYDRHAARLLGLARRILGESGESEEVLQEVFLFAWRAAATFDPARGNVLTWLLIATRSRAIATIISAENFFSRRSRADKLSPSRYSITMKALPSV